jgi:hypothetical protein
VQHAFVEVQPEAGSALCMREPMLIMLGDPPIKKGCVARGCAERRTRLRQCIMWVPLIVVLQLPLPAAQPLLAQSQHPIIEVATLKLEAGITREEFEK